MTAHKPQRPRKPRLEIKSGSRVWGGITETGFVYVGASDDHHEAQSCSLSDADTRRLHAFLTKTVEWLDSLKGRRK